MCQWQSQVNLGHQTPMSMTFLPSLMRAGLPMWVGGEGKGRGKRLTKIQAIGKCVWWGEGVSLMCPRSHLGTVSLTSGPMGGSI